MVSGCLNRGKRVEGGGVLGDDKGGSESMA